VRLLDVPVSGQFGAWDNLQGSPNGAAFSEALKQAAATHYGHAGRAFLERLTHDTQDFFGVLEHIKALPEFSIEGGEGQDKRAAARFALVALAGELATEYEITGWEEGTAIEAAAEGFKAWRSLRGRGNDERRQILERLSAFIERHGDSRFSDMNVEPEAMRINRAGWWREDVDERVYLLNNEGLREALTGFDFKRALDALQEAGALAPGDADSKRSKMQRTGGRLLRLYTIFPDKLEADHGA
jgi:putative DNA primase/helicase